MIVAGTGHRPPRLGGYSAETDIRLIRLAKAWLLPRKQEIAHCISGMALGWDQCLARACVMLKIPFDAYVPFKGQDSVWPEESRRMYAWLLERARKVIYVCDPGYETWKLIARDKRMADDATDMLALFDGLPKGGTWTTIRYAQNIKRPIHNLWDQWEAACRGTSA